MKGAAVATTPDEARLVARLLDDGRVLDCPSEEEDAWLVRLEREFGLVATRRKSFFVCVDPTDPESEVYSVIPDCRARISLDAESAPPDCIRCEACGNDHWPQERARTLYARIIISAPLAFAIGYVERMVQAVDRRAQRLRDSPAWRVAVGRKEVVVSLLDGCLGTEFETDEYCRSHPVLHVVAARRLYTDRMGGASWIRPLPIVELLVGGLDELRRRLRELAAAQYPYAAAGGPARVHLPGRIEHLGALASLWHAERAPEPGLWEEEFRVAGIPVATSAQPRLLALVRHLAAVRAEEVRRGRSPEECRWLTALDIAEALDELFGVLRSDVDTPTNEDTVDRYIRTLNSEAQAALAAAGKEGVLGGPLVASRTERSELGPTRRFMLNTRLMS